MREMQIRVLGPIDAIDDEGTNVPLGGPAQLRLLALLVAASPASIAVDDVVHELWADQERPDDPIGTVRTYVARLRRALGPEAVTT
ncbi:MAG: winged helix-turn-helix domain-containing protein, partial [Acidimicrobiales bacterium]